MPLKKLTLGVYGPNYFGGFSPFLNWWKTGASPTIGRSVGGSLIGKAIWDAGIYLNPATGEIVNPAPSDLVSYTRVFFTPVNVWQTTAGCNYNNETWVCEWDGSATAVASGFGAGGSSTPAGSNKLNINSGSSQGNMQVALTLTNLNDPPRNVRVYQARYATNVANGEKFNPDWLSEVRKVGNIRFGPGWQFVNDETIYDFATLADESYVTWCASFTDGVSREGLPSPKPASPHGPKGNLHPSLMCQLSNITGQPIHVGIPCLATDACVTAMATYFRDHTTNVVTYERGNESWNPQFSIFYSNQSRGARFWGKQVTAWITGSPSQLTVPGHGFANASTVQLYSTATGYTTLAFNQVVTVLDANTLTIAVDSTGFPAFSGTDTWMSNDDARIGKYQGYRAATDMKIIRDIYNDRSRWRGAFATHPGDPSYTTAMKTGVDYWRANVLSPANSLTYTDLFNDVYITGYFAGATPVSKAITNITQANPGVVTSASHGFNNGDKIKIFIKTGMTQLNNTYATVANGTANTFELQGINTTAMSAWVADNQNYCQISTLFDIIDTSKANNTADPVTWPTKYTYFNQQVSTAHLTGTCPAGYTTSSSVASAQATLWPQHYTSAKNMSLGLRQYEGGCHFLGNGNLVADGVNTEFNEFIIQYGHSPECASVYAASFKAFIRVGGNYPCKFVADGTTSQFGTWGGVRFWPLAGNSNTSDISNPVWQACVNFNENPQPETWTVRFGT